MADDLGFAGPAALAEPVRSRTATPRELVGRLGAEDVLYSLAAQLERAAPWADRRPPGF